MDKDIFNKMKNIRKKANDYFCEQMKKNNIKKICSSHGSILIALYRAENSRMQMNEIAKTIKRSKSTVTELVNKLVRLDYVKKEKCSSDSRITYIKLTKKGQKIKDKYERIYNNLLEKTFKGFSDDEIRFLKGLLNRLNNNL
ncbi:MAG: MarR family transcriptional regulator [Candidatus Mcinerneyibacterium aminivorans]|uniref:MarR family transcriptional regulator n=1 Tax=Candidatus Mcinerneyibacterium aminivorans TaxID=2703815 RepID=A0A5D0MBH2_9BACT|nr:MAG: MarR family transcriptional regulator [Candidatus Mcinerneyibacterium aminivorans]